MDNMVGIDCGVWKWVGQRRAKGENWITVIEQQLKKPRQIKKIKIYAWIYLLSNDN